VGHGHCLEIESRSPSASQRIHLLRAAFPVLPSLIDERPSNELNRVEFADREAVEPCLAFAAETPEPSAASVPLCDVDAVRAALAEEDDGHGELVYAWGEQNTKLSEDSEFCGGSTAGPPYFILLPCLTVRESSTNGFLTPEDRPRRHGATRGSPLPNRGDSPGA
jgi:hypothetical protein